MFLSLLHVYSLPMNNDILKMQEKLAYLEMQLDESYTHIHMLYSKIDELEQKIDVLKGLIKPQAAVCEAHEETRPPHY